MHRATAPVPRRRLPPAARRAQLLGCALEAFAAEGVGGASHAAVARLAGVSVPTVFHYFPSREALVDAVLDEVERYYTELASGIHDAEGTAATRLTAHGLAFLASAHTHPAHLRVWLDWSTAIREHVWPRYLAFQERLVGTVSATVAAGIRAGDVPAPVDPETAARLFVGNAHMAATMTFTPGARLDLPGLVRRAVSALLGA